MNKDCSYVFNLNINKLVKKKLIGIQGTGMQKTLFLVKVFNEFLNIYRETADAATHKQVMFMLIFTILVKNQNTETEKRLSDCEQFFENTDIDKTAQKISYEVSLIHERLVQSLQSETLLLRRRLKSKDIRFREGIQY